MNPLAIDWVDKLCRRHRRFFFAEIAKSGEKKVASKKKLRQRETGLTCFPLCAPRRCAIVMVTRSLLAHCCWRADSSLIDPLGFYDARSINKTPTNHIRLVDIFKRAKWILAITTADRQIERDGAIAALGDETKHSTVGAGRCVDVAKSRAIRLWRNFQCFARLLHAFETRALLLLCHSWPLSLTSCCYGFLSLFIKRRSLFVRLLRSADDLWAAISGLIIFNNEKRIVSSGWNGFDGGLA